MFDMPHFGAACSTKLSNVAALNPSLDEKPAPDEVVSFVPMAALSAEIAGVVREAARPYAEVAKGYTAFQSGDLLVAKITPCFENNKIGYANISRHLGFGSTEFHVVRPNAERLDTRYLLHFLRQDHVRAEGERRMTGSAGQRRVPENFLANLMVPVPSIAEQRRIAAILDQADALRAKRRAALARLDEMGRAIFVEMFGGDTNVEQRWSTVPLGEILGFMTSGSRGWAAHYSEQGDLFIRIQNVTRNGLDLNDVVYVQTPQTMEARRTRVQAGDVLLSITADLGRTAVIPEKLGPAYINQHLALLRQSRFHPVFLSQYLSTPHAQEQIQRRNKQGVKAGLNFDDVKALRVPLPPRTQQDAYAERYAQLGRIRAKQVEGEKETNALFTSLQHRAFRGEL